MASQLTPTPAPRRGDPAGDFYSVDAALADSLKVPCTALLDIPNSGHLEGTVELHLRKGTNLELPFWLASHLITKDIMQLKVPPSYGARVRNALTASARSVNLRNLGGGGGAFYAGGVLLAHSTQGIMVDAPLVEALDSSYRERMIEVMDQSQHTSADGGGEGAAYEFCQGLDSWEKQLFHRGETAAKEFKQWSEVKSKKGR